MRWGEPGGMLEELGLPFWRGGGEQRGEGRSERLGAGLKPGGLGFIAGAEGLRRSEPLEFQPDGSVQLGVVQIGGAQVDPGHVGASQIGFDQDRPV